ncbi:MAG: 4-(cytidine 5'-diphospho)-2-C-methyl-D-erythritol kinase [Deltaproteobacteria bacterium CG11_big_fil_rev_8_21_14_0_20_42_23]|nr:MAG: 4-(cytidine 5'-diphospho)-2-C-methyl-D-erythritol kinase [Deltaproteobacteria bacterium CG11_big_fil_rev_8_21_14_0_20_42_23]PJC64704.1 MAG: 4-(cytidine 5'-diphospho)-2-C-methyl-D-erythritol kinase [Deltaproteobacteria bacterium CG_4_9_14_0_2_um_filter_42_21]
MKKISVSAPAKINTILRVVALRPDFYHELEMVMVKLKLADLITIHDHPETTAITFSCDSIQNEGMNAHNNLVVKAAKLLQETYQVKRGASIHLEKNIPVAAGLGGGSSDAASTLKALNCLWDLKLDANALAKHGESLGADVPFFCHESPAAYVHGIGEKIQPIDCFPKLFLLLVNPGIEVSTAWVYKECDKLFFPGGPGTKKQKRTLEKQSDKDDFQLTGKNAGVRRGAPFAARSEVLCGLTNDLEEVTRAKYLEISEMKEFFLKFGADAALMSGSGPTVFGVFKTRELSVQAEKQLPSSWKGFVTETL